MTVKYQIRTVNTDNIRKNNYTCRLQVIWNCPKANVSLTVCFRQQFKCSILWLRLRQVARKWTIRKWTMLELQFNFNYWLIQYRSFVNICWILIFLKLHVDQPSLQATGFRYTSLLSAVYRKPLASEDANVRHLLPLSQLRFSRVFIVLMFKIRIQILSTKYGVRLNIRYPGKPNISITNKYSYWE